MTRRRILVAIVVALAGLQPATPVRAAVGVSSSADDTWGTEIAATGKAGRVLAVAVSGGLWNPTANTPTGPYAAAADGTHLYVVGEFTKMGGVRHVGLAVFSGSP